jgi:hypothetical protein
MSVPDLSRILTLYQLINLLSLFEKSAECYEVADRNIRSFDY